MPEILIYPFCNDCSKCDRFLIEAARPSREKGTEFILFDIVLPVSSTAEHFEAEAQQAIDRLKPGAGWKIREVWQSVLTIDDDGAATKIDTAVAF